MPAKPFDYTALLAPGLPPPAARWTGFPRFNFVGGHNDPDQVPVGELTAAMSAVLAREGRTLATYGLESGPLGYRPLRDWMVAKLKRHAGITCSADEILLTSGSLQAIDLINTVLLAPGDTVIAEQANYSGVLSRFQRLGVTPVGIELDKEGMRADMLEAELKKLKSRGVRAKYIYVIPTVQNPTGLIMGSERRKQILALADAYGVPVFEDECYSDLVWAGTRPQALYGMSASGNVIHVGSFSKSVSPALRVGYIVAPWPMLSRIVSVKHDAGSGALEQMLLGEFCPRHFDAHVPKLNKALRAKLETLMEALAEQFGTAAEFEDPPGGIFLWIKLPDQVDTLRLSQAALAEGVTLNPGPEWAMRQDYSRSRLRLCYANPSHEQIRAGVAKLAEICHREFGVPVRRANVEGRR